MVKLILADGTELKGFKQNGSNYVSQTEVDVSVFEDNLSTLTIVDGDTQMVMHNAELIQQVKYEDEEGWHLCFRELTPVELQERKIAEMMAKISAPVEDSQGNKYEQAVENGEIVLNKIENADGTVCIKL